MKIIYPILLLVCSSCLRLDAVQQYAAESQAAAAQFKEITPTFRALCQQKRQLRDLSRGRAQRTYQDSCALHLRADSAAQAMQTILVDYLTALQSVSSGGRIAYDLSPVGQAISSNSLISLDENTVTAYQSLLELLTTAATEAYRRREVERLVAQAHPSLVTLIDQLRFVTHESLREAVAQQQEMQYLNVRELADSAQTFVERRSLWQEYIGQAEQYEQQQQQLDTYAALLNTIKEGHQQLYDQRKRLDRKETVSALAYHLRELRQLQTTFQPASDE